MIHLNTRSEFIDEDHRNAVIRVQTSRCFYQVAIKRREEVTVVGPGIEEVVEFTEEQLRNLSYHGIAAMAVIQIEEGN